MPPRDIETCFRDSLALETVVVLIPRCQHSNLAAQEATLHVTGDFPFGIVVLLSVTGDFLTAKAVISKRFP